MDTVAAALARGVRALERSSPTPRADAQILLAFALGRDREWLIAHGDDALSSEEMSEYDALCEKRASGAPVAYITGVVGFYKREFAVNEHVLIPRPETEHLIDDALAHLRAKQKPAIFEAGAGSGAIACTIAAEIPGATVDATDISSEALEVARRNARRLNVEARCRFVQADVVENGAAKTYDLVIANLPYIPQREVPEKPDPVGFEPRLALDGGPDGLLQYRRLLEAVPRMLRPGALLLMEAAPPTIHALAALTRAALPGAAVEIRRDYADLERYVAAGSLHRNGE